MNFAKFLKAPFLQNSSGRLLLLITQSQWVYIAMGCFLWPYVKLCGVSDISVMFITYYYICKLQISMSYPIVMKKLERTIKSKLIFWKKKSFIILTKK